MSEQTKSGSEMKCIFCDKKFDMDDLHSWGDENTCEPCMNEVLTEVEEKGTMKRIIYPEGVRTIEGFLEYIDDHLDFFEEEIGEPISAWKIVRSDDRSCDVKYIS